jgi:hypothetical protein
VRIKIFSVNKTEGRSSGKSFPKTDQTFFCSGARFRIVEKILLSNEELYFLFHCELPANPLITVTNEGSFHLS